MSSYALEPLKKVFTLATAAYEFAKPILKNSWRLIPGAAAASIFALDYELAKNMIPDENISTLYKFAVPAGVGVFGAFYAAAAAWPLPEKVFNAAKTKLSAYPPFIHFARPK